MQLLEGKLAAEKIKTDLSQQVSVLKKKELRPPNLAAVLVGHNGASETYVASKIKNCAEIGFMSSLVRFEETISQQDLVAKIKELNDNDEVDGILVQLPLPKHIDDQEIINIISPEKDVDGFHPANLGKLT